MALNIFPKRPEVKVAPMVIEDPAKQEKEPEAKAAPAETAEADPPRRTATRRGTRGGRSRSRTAAAAAETTGEATAEAPAEEDGAEAKPAPRRRTTRTRARSTEAEDDKKTAEADDDADEKPRRATARRRTTTPTEPAADGIASREIVRAIEDLGQQIKELTKLQKELLAGSGGATASSRPARVGIFVDVANVELGADRLRARIDWGKVLRMLTRDRQLVRAIAYSPVHDDPGVSRETQRFVEPFLDKGYKITTKPLKRFADGSVKANVDIELALDVVNMLDRLDVVCLVSGDGDFEPLVVAAQNRGVRVEVVSVGSSTANSLRQAADRHIDLQSILSEIRV